MVQCCVKLTLSNFLNSGFLLVDCYIYYQNVTFLKRFTRHGHYAGEVKGIPDPQLFLKLLCQNLQRLAAV